MKLLERGGESLQRRDTSRNHASFQAASETESTLNDTESSKELSEKLDPALSGILTVVRMEIILGTGERCHWTSCTKCLHFDILYLDTYGIKTQ